LNQLRDKLITAHKRITDLEEINRKLKQQLHDQQLQGKLNDTQDLDFPPLTTQTFSPPQNSTASKWAKPLRPPTTQKLISPEIKQRRIAAAARVFQRPSATHGFKYLYFPSKARMPVGQMRAALRQFGVDNSRVLDIQYPARQTIGFLVHNDF
ncbi:hypothetical protein BDC45DRAFT_415964, partial [Circinella umbellata]